MSHFVLDVTHIGEEFVSLLCKTAQGKKSLKEIMEDRSPETNFNDILTSYVIPNKNIEIITKKGDENFQIDVALKGDAKSQIDVALIGANCCYAMELKLGSSVSTPGEYCARYLNKRYQVQNNSNKFKGNMIPLLARLGMDNQPIIVRCCRTAGVPKQIRVNRKWILMVRNEKIREKLNAENTLQQGTENQVNWENMKNNCIIVSLQEFLSKLNEDEIESCIKKCIEPPDNGKYIDAWNLRCTSKATSDPQEAIPDADVFDPESYAICDGLI